jgi:hypothetical protein
LSRGVFKLATGFIQILFSEQSALRFCF